MTQKNKKLFWYIAGIVVADLIVIVVVLVLLRTPQNNRNWTTDQTILPQAIVTGDTVTIKNIRNFTYTSATTSTPAYYDKTFSIGDVTGVEYIVEPLADIAVAHTLLSFGLRDGSHIALSVEIRKEVGEKFSPIWGLFNEYELMYVAMDERDALSLRAIIRDNPVYLYPTNATPQVAQQLLVAFLERMNTLAEHPEFYNTITNTCTTNIVDHLNALGITDMPFDYRILMPKNSDVLAYEYGLLALPQSPAVIREAYRIDAAVRDHVADADFSAQIRAGLPAR